MSADVAQTQLAAFDIIDFDHYSDMGTSYAPPPEGVYTGKAPIITDEAFGVTAEGYLKVTVDPIEIVTPGPGQGYKVRFTRLSAKKYKNREGSQVADYLRACGIAARPKNNDELKAALKMTSGRTMNFSLIWEAFNKETKETTSGWENFPPDPANPAQRLTYVPDQFDENKKWYANGRVKYFVSAVKK